MLMIFEQQMHFDELKLKLDGENGFPMIARCHIWGIFTNFGHTFHGQETKKGSHNPNPGFSQSYSHNFLSSRLLFQCLKCSFTLKSYLYSYFCGF
mmetsp:Transcript_6707/g.8828  ORF Transcript_6707/g.8828 Transcript_6707/m.8828 type:complete len:95 (+) Transcript_6707:927-1211(+)